MKNNTLLPLSSSFKIEFNDVDLFVMSFLTFPVIFLYLCWLFIKGIHWILQFPRRRSAVVTSSHDQWLYESSMVCEMVKWTETEGQFELQSPTPDLKICASDSYTSSYPTKLRYFKTINKGGIKKLYVIISVNRQSWFESDEYFPLRLMIPDGKGKLYKPIHDFLCNINISFFIGLIEKKYFSQVIFAGHGIGGAFAQVLALKCNLLTSTITKPFVSITFGVGQYGDLDCITSLNKIITARFPNCFHNFLYFQDIVPLIPPKNPNSNPSLSSASSSIHYYDEVRVDDLYSSVRKGIIESLYSTNHLSSKFSEDTNDWERIQLYINLLLKEMSPNEMIFVGGNWILYDQEVKPFLRGQLYLNQEKTMYSFEEHHIRYYSWSFPKPSSSGEINTTMIPLLRESFFWYDLFHPEIDIRIENIPNNNKAPSRVDSFISDGPSYDLLLQENNIIFHIIGNHSFYFDLTKCYYINLFYDNEILFIDIHDSFIDDDDFLQTIDYPLLSKEIYTCIYHPLEIKIEINTMSYQYHFPIQRIEVIYRAFPFFKPLSKMKVLE